MVIDEQVNKVRALAEKHGFHVVAEDVTRPWGAWFLLDEADLERFAALYFPDLDLGPTDGRPQMSPKFLAVAPHQRLSWQRHDRRSEHWRVVDGPVGVARSRNERQPEPQWLDAGRVIELAQGEHHRLIGLDTPGLVAEIWVHTDPHRPSDEDDIVRVQDDYERS